MDTSVPVLVTDAWNDYELIDSGDGAKLERFGSYTVSRPDPRAIWRRTAPEQIWSDAHASYVRSSADDGSWNIRISPPTPWHISYKGISFSLRPTSFKHVGVFPEQASNWDWMRGVIAGKRLRVLNLFAYTGGATIASTLAGAFVTHVDSAKSAIDWAKENAAASGLPRDSIRWIEDDVQKFVSREIKRNAVYDAIILDPPRFGRGSQGEVWKISEHLPELLRSCMSVLSPDPAFVLLNAYTADLSAIVLDRLLRSHTEALGGTVLFGELTVRESASRRLLPNGIFARWSRA